MALQSFDKAPQNGTPILAAGDDGIPHLIAWKPARKGEAPQWCRHRRDVPEFFRTPIDFVPVNWSENAEDFA